MTTLAELRLANLREQKKSAEEPSPAEPTPAPTAHVYTAAPAPPAQNSRQEDLVLAQYLTDAEQSATLEPIPVTEAEKSEALIAHVHQLLSTKKQHPTGAKATVDMSPALFHRAKRYCLDHGNVTLRQLFLDLMTAFLDEEGY